MLLEPASSFVQNRFTSEAAWLLLAGNATHADIPMTAPGSGLFGLLMAMLGQTVGYPVPEGGAGRLAAALADRFTSLGGQIRTGTHVRRIDVDSGRVTGVTTDDGERFEAMAVVADMSATALYGDLVPWSQLPAKVRRQCRPSARRSCRFPRSRRVSRSRPVPSRPTSRAARSAVVACGTTGSRSAIRRRRTTSAAIALATA